MNSPLHFVALLFEKEMLIDKGIYRNITGSYDAMKISEFSGSILTEDISISSAAFFFQIRHLPGKQHSMSDCIFIDKGFSSVTYTSA